MNKNSEEANPPLKLTSPSGCCSAMIARAFCVIISAYEVVQNKKAAPSFEGVVFLRRGDSRGIKIDGNVIC